VEVVQELENQITELKVVLQLLLEFHQLEVEVADQ
tara:strand:+ start:177 stop:281 length:105 start_codon:yes stop_codon:yes gene_type:complete